MNERINHLVKLEKMAEEKLEKEWKKAIFVPIIP